MAASQEQKVDFLLKKIGYVSSKTGIAEDSTLSGTVKAPFAEPIPSPLVVPSTSIWSDSSLIPATPPGSTSAIVQVYATASAKQLTVDSTVSGNRTFLARATPGNNSTAMEGNWIDPSFGADYVIKVFKGDPNSGGVQLSAAGSGSNDTWFFDYSSGVLNFNGTNVPSGVTATNIYLVGYRYLGGTGFNVSGPASFENLLVTGISTLGSSNGIGTVTIGIGGSALHVDGDARIIGKTFIGDGTITIDPDSNLININGSQIQRDSGGDLMIMTAGTSNYSKLRASDFLIDTNTVIDNNRNYTGVAATFANMTITGDLTVEGTTTTLDTNLIGVDKLEIGANNSTVAAGITQSGSGNILNLYDSSSVVFSVEDGGRIVGTATSSVIPFLHPTLASLPNAGTYHGAFAHVHSEGKGYFAHGGNWFELVNKELNGTVGTGTETYDVGAATFSGLVKIGTTTEGIAGANNLTIADSSNAGVTIRSGTTSNGNIYFSDATSGNAEYDGFIQYNQQTRYLRFGTAQVERFRISSDGKVGINTTTLTEQLEVDGDIRVRNQVKFRDPNGDESGAIGLNDDDNFTIQSFGTYGHITFDTGSTAAERLRITSAGLVGIGITNPDTKLVVSNGGTSSSASGGTLARIVGSGVARLDIVAGNSNHSILEFSRANLTAAGQVTYTHSDNSLSFTVNGAQEKLRITSDGKVRVPDNGKFVAGADDDLQIKHTGNDAYLDNYTGHLYIRQETNGEDVYIQCDNGSGGLANYVKCDGSTGAVELGHYGNTKLETTSSGVNVTGNTETDDLTVTGTAYLNGTVSVASSTGTNGQVLSSTGVGVTWTTLPTARTTSTQTAIEDQTTFNFTYNVGFLDVFYNGVKLAPTEFTASNGSQVVLNDVAYAGDLVEFVSYGTVSTGGGGGGASSLNELSDVTITGTPVVGETLTHNGTKFVNDYTATTTTTATTQVSILSLDLSVYRSAEYQIQVTEGSKYHTTKILAIHNGTAASHNEFGTLSIGAVPATFDVDISGSNLRLLATPASSNSTVFKVKFTAIKV